MLNSEIWRDTSRIFVSQSKIFIPCHLASLWRKGSPSTIRSHTQPDRHNTNYLLTTCEITYFLLKCLVRFSCDWWSYFWWPVGHIFDDQWVTADKIEIVGNDLASYAAGTVAAKTNNIMYINFAIICARWNHDMHHPSWLYWIWILFDAKKVVSHIDLKYSSVV